MAEKNSKQYPIIDNTEGYIRVRQAAELLSVPEISIYNLCEKKILPSYKLGRRRLLKYSEIIEVMERNRIEADR